MIIYLASWVQILFGVLYASTLQVRASCSPRHLACQLQKPAPVSPLSGCPHGTLFVSKDDPRAHFKTVQAAVLSLLETGEATILVGAGMDDAQSAVLIVAPSFNASLIDAGPTGAPLQPLFGSNGFKAYNIDFANRAVSPQPDVSQANFSISQALVTDISYANASFYGCSFASFQDTWYTGPRIRSVKLR